MAELQNFRTAFNGFHRDDVVRYIEELNTKHKAEVNRLKSDLKYLQEKLDALEAEASAPAPAAAPVPVAPVYSGDAAVQALEQELAQAQEAARKAEAQLIEQMAENKRLQALLDATLTHQSDDRARQQEVELDIYRRAERVEREARSRAGVVYEQVTSALSDATSRVEETADQIAALSDASMKQLKQLQLAISGSKQILRDTAASIGTIRPKDEE